jgi:hypothetical protein
MPGKEPSPEMQAHMDSTVAELFAQVGKQGSDRADIWAEQPALANTARGPAPQPGIFDAAAYLAEPEQNAFRWYTMPDGKRVCLHTPTPDDAEKIGRAIVRDLNQLGLYRQVETKEEREDLDRERQFVAQHRYQVWAVVACARQGEEPDAPRVFTEQQVTALRKRKRFGPVIDEMAGIVKALEEGQQTEAERLREWLTGFFGSVRNSLGVLSLKLEEGKTEECQAGLDSLSEMLQEPLSTGEPA